MARVTNKLKIGESPDLGVQLIGDLLLYPQLRLYLQSLNVRFDDKVAESLAFILAKLNSDTVMNGELQWIPLDSDTYKHGHSR